MDAQIVVALLGAGGIIGAAAVGAFVTFRKDSAALALQIASETREELKDVRERLDEMERRYGIEVDAHAETKKRLEKKIRVLSEKYHAALKWIGVVHTLWEGLKARLRLARFEHGEIPPLPMLIAVDFEQSEVEAQDNGG